MVKKKLTQPAIYSWRLIIFAFVYNQTRMKILFSGLLFFLFSSVFAQDTFTDERDGNVYHTIVVNGTTWMKDNLRFTGINGASCFDNDNNNLPIYGALYDWKTAQSACPSGWHLPSGDDFRGLVDHFDQNDKWAKGPNEQETFNIQLGGHQDFEGVFSEMDESGYYWSSTEYSNDNAEYFSYMTVFGIPVADVSRQQDIDDISGTEKTNRYSIRCIKDTQR